MSNQAIWIQQKHIEDGTIYISIAPEDRTNCTDGVRQPLGKDPTATHEFNECRKMLLALGCKRSFDVKTLTSFQPVVYCRD